MIQSNNANRPHLNRPYSEAGLDRFIANLKTLGINLTPSVATRIKNCSDPQVGFDLLVGAFTVGTAAWGFAGDEVGGSLQECIETYIESAMDDMGAWVEVRG